MYIPEFNTQEEFTAFKRQLHHDMTGILRFYAKEIIAAVRTAHTGGQPLIDGDIIPPTSGDRIYLDNPIGGITITLNWNGESEYYQLNATAAGCFTASHPLDPEHGEFMSTTGTYKKTSPPGRCHPPRLHEALGYLTPAEVEAAYTDHKDVASVAS